MNPHRQKPSLKTPEVADLDELRSSIFQVTQAVGNLNLINSVNMHILRLSKRNNLTNKYKCDIMVLWEFVRASRVTRPPHPPSSTRSRVVCVQHRDPLGSLLIPGAYQ